MNFQELKREWEYAYNERIGILCEDSQPTQEQEREARLCADRHINRLNDLYKKGEATGTTR